MALITRIFAGREITRTDTKNADQSLISFVFSMFFRGQTITPNQPFPYLAADEQDLPEKKDITPRGQRSPLDL
jgi:hypothetical protein